jgi:hypothetical protein
VSNRSFDHTDVDDTRPYRRTKSFGKYDHIEWCPTGHLTIIPWAIPGLTGRPIRPGGAAAGNDRSQHDASNAKDGANDVPYQHSFGIFAFLGGMRAVAALVEIKSNI